MSQVHLYSATACPYAHRTRLVLLEKQIPFELTEIDLQNKPAWFSQISRYGKVPAIRHGEAEIYESAIINEYLEEVFPEPPLLPKHPGQRAIARLWIDYANNHFTSAFGKLLRGKNTEEQEQGRQALTEALLYIESEVFGKLSGNSTYWLGDQLTLVDLAFYPWFERLPALQSLRQFAVPQDTPQLQNWWRTLEARPTIQSIANSVDFYIERYAKFVPSSVAIGSTSR
ncbi:glutathione S-transferase family protein [Alkalinema pantanalense]|uniref:glutathione S-transferase family protein n=1 Tax=Alkalinema pantanalense TaxID=1620705 RepID=UPI003D6E05C0